MLETIKLAAKHSRTMRLMIGPANEAVIPQTASKQAMIAAIEAAELDMHLTVGGIPVEKRMDLLVCGEWTTRDVIAHLADWDVYFAAWLEQLCTGKPNELYFDHDEHRFNEWLQQQRKSQTWEQLWNDFQINRQAILDRLRTVSENEFLSKKEAPFGTIYHCAWSALEHYLDHSSGIRREIGMALPKELLHFQGPYTE